MRKTLIALLFCTTICSAAAAQDKETQTPDFRKSFTVKFAPAGLGIGKATFGGEFNFKRKSAITLLLGAPFDKTNSITYDSKSSDIISSARSAMLGYRYYLGKKATSGFYLEPYAKYLKFTAAGFLNADLNWRAARFDSHFEYEGYGAGLQLGFQFYIARLVAIDLFLVGPEANTAKFNSTSTDVYNNIPWSLADSDQAAQDIHDKLKDIPYAGNKIDVTVNTNTKTVFTAYKGFAPGFRSGISVGIRF